MAKASDRIRKAVNKNINIDVDNVQLVTSFLLDLTKENSKEDVLKGILGFLNIQLIKQQEIVCNWENNNIPALKGKSIVSTFTLKNDVITITTKPKE